MNDTKVEKNSVVSNHEPETVKSNTLTIPARPATMIPEVPAHEIQLPCYIKLDENYYRIDATGKYINVWVGKYVSQISSFDYGDFTPGEVSSFIREPHKYEIIEAEEFFDAFNKAQESIMTALHSVMTVPPAEDFDDTDYGEDDEVRHAQWMAEQEDNFLNPDLP